MRHHDDNSAAMCKARKASPDWHGISVLTGLMKFGPLTLDPERDKTRILAMSPKHQAKAVELFNRFVELEKEVSGLHDEISNEIRDSIK